MQNNKDWNGTADESSTAVSTLVDLLTTAINRYPDRIAFIEGEAQITYREIDRLSAGLASFLEDQLRFEQGSRVAIMLPNSIPFPISAIGVLRSGGVIVNVNPLYTERELNHQLRDAGVDIIIVEKNFVSCVAKSIMGTEVKNIIVVGDFCEPSEALSDRVGVFAWNDVLVSRHRTKKSSSINPEPDSIALLQYTGGTTGLSKGAILRHRNIVANSIQICTALDLTSDSQQHFVLTALPLYHIFAFTVNFVTMFSIGACNVLIRNPSELDTVLLALKSHPITFITGVNTLYANILRHNEADQVDWARLAFAIGGGSAILPRTSEEWREMTGRHILEGLGMTETSPVLTVNPPGNSHFSGTVGVPLPGTDIVIIGDKGMPCATGDVGEICVRGPQVMSGYWGFHSEEAEFFTSDGFFKTGDIGWLDEAGYLKIVDRKKDMILVSGFNVFPNEVEAIASEHRSVLECACVGIPDDRTGEAVKIFLNVANYADFDADDFMRHCRSRLAGYKVPRYLELVNELPKSNVGKILRRQLR